MSEGKSKRKKRYLPAANRHQWSSGGGYYSASSGSRGGRPNPCKLFVGNISFKVSAEQVKDVFAEFGPVAYCQIVTDQKTKRPKGYGFVEFENVAAVERALAASEDQLTLDGRMMAVEKHCSRKQLLAAREGVAGGDIGEDRGAKVSGEVEQQQPVVTETEPQLPHQPTKVPELSDDVMFMVLCRLGLKDRIRVERVCKRWCCLARASWQYVGHISFKNCFHPFQGKKYTGLTDDILQSVLSRGGKSVLSLDLSCGPKFISCKFGLNIIGMYCTSLERLDLSGVPVTQNAMKRLSQRCPELKWLRVSGSHSVGENCVWWGLNIWKKLEFLNIGENTRITGQCLYQARDTLLHVHLPHCKKLVDRGVELLAARCPRLQTLDISHCHKLTGASLRSVSECEGVDDAVQNMAYPHNRIIRAEKLCVSHSPL